MRTALALSRKTFWEQLRPTLEFVVFFLPGESFFSAALEQDRDLIKVGAARRVILATPNTLISLLKTASHGWKQATVAANAERVAEMGRALHRRVEATPEK